MTPGVAESFRQGRHSTITKKLAGRSARQNRNRSGLLNDGDEGGCPERRMRFVVQDESG